MRNEPNLRIENYRANHPILGPGKPGKNYGYFEVGPLRIISSGSWPDDGWEHVSVSLPHRCPTWTDMEHVKQLFWGDQETVLQFHPKKSEYVNVHPYCLHLWRETNSDYELPPTYLLA